MLFLYCALAEKYFHEIIQFSKYILFFIDNLALKKSAFQQHPYRGLSQYLVDANNAIDGLKSNLSVWGGQCTLSDNLQTTATWWVNLASIVSIHHITIYYMTGNEAWGMSIR